MLEKVIVNLIGTGRMVIRHPLAEDLLSRMQATAGTLRAPLEQAIFDAEFFSLLQIPGYDSIHNLGNKESRIIGFSESVKSQIEIRIDGRKKRAIGYRELINPKTLFPLYHVFDVPVTGMNGPHLQITEEYVGLIAIYELHVNSFDFDRLTFHIQDSLLIGLKYNGRVLSSSSNDYLVTSQSCCICK